MLLNHTRLKAIEEKPEWKDAIEYYHNFLIKYDQTYERAYQALIEAPPQPMEILAHQASGPDGLTCTAFGQLWTDNLLENSKSYDFLQNSAMLEHMKFMYYPAVVIAAGPSLKKNVHLLKEHNDVVRCSCLHCFAYLMDQGVKVNYWLAIDAQPEMATVIYDGGKKPRAEYQEMMKDQVLICNTCINPKVLSEWKGKVLFFNTMANVPEYQKAAEEKCKDLVTFNQGGSVTGACLYMARAILGCGPIAFVGLDLAYSKAGMYYPWNDEMTHQSKIPNATAMTDIYGDRVITDGSWLSFKSWIEFTACGGSIGAKHNFYNCTEGGILGAHPQGNLRKLMPMDLKQFLDMVDATRHMPEVLKSNFRWLYF